MPNTLHLDATNFADILRAADLLRSGRLVAFATETVYGLGANALSAEAVATIFAAKDRPSWDPLIVHIASASQIRNIASIPPHLASRIAHLAQSFWPGPLTLLLPRNVSIPDAVTAGRPLVGVRIPAHPVALALLEAANLPIAAPSANLFGHTSPTTAQHVLADLNSRIDAVLDAGPTSIGLESTVLDPTQTPMVLYRPGAITPAQLTAATGVDVHIFAPPTNLGALGPASGARVSTLASLPAPGVGLRHYAPNARLILTGPTPGDLSRELATYPTAAILNPTNWPPLSAILTQPWADWDNPSILAATLFSALRALDDQGATTILAPLPPPGGLNDAIRDRLQKAAVPK